MRPTTLVILALVFVLVNAKTCQKYSVPRISSLRGHIGHFRQNLTGYPKSMDMAELLNDGIKVLFMGVEGGADTFRFVSTIAEPFVFALNDKDGFTIWGPMYSTIKETAMRLNYRSTLLLII